MSLDEIYRRMNDDTEAPEIDLSNSKVREFFAGKKILLSGATGYVGRVFIEKILRDCSEIERLYVLVREKKGVAPEDKMKRYFENVIFDKVRNTNPNFSDKVTTITGDLQLDKLGLSPEDRLLLNKNIDIIVHTAATTKFDEKVSTALQINVIGTENMLDLAVDCEQIQAFVHVSTGYSHCVFPRRNVEEKFYESPIDLEKVRDLIARDEADGFNEKDRKKILGKWPNIYTFSKAIAEGLVKQYGDRAEFAVAVFRPTIIIAARKEPLPGYVNKNNMLTLTFMGVALGVLHAIYHDTNSIVDMIPVDLTVNALVATVYDSVEQWKVTKKPAVYNFGSRTSNPLRLDIMTNWLLAEGPKIGSTHSLWYPFYFSPPTYWRFFILNVIFHFLPALIADVVLICMRKEPKALKMFFFVTKNMSAIDYFGNKNWRIHTNKTLDLYDRLNEADQTIFNFDVRKLDWEFMTVLYTRGARLYILNESMDNLEQAKKRYFKLKRIHYVVTSFVFLLAGYFMMNLFSYVRLYFSS